LTHSVEPNRYNAHKNLGISLEGQREYHQAIKAYVEAIKREPLDPRALVHLEDLMDREPYLSIEDPGLEGVLGRCQRWVARFRGEDWREE